MVTSRKCLCRLIITVLKIQTKICKDRKLVKMESFKSTTPIWSLSHKPTIKITIKSICPVPIWRIFVWKIFCKLLSNCLWQSLFLVKSHAFSIFFCTPVDVKTTFKLQRSQWKNFWWKHMKNESCKWYLGNVSSCASIGGAIWFWAAIFCMPDQACK